MIYKMIRFRYNQEMKIQNYIEKIPRREKILASLILFLYFLLFLIVYLIPSLTFSDSFPMALAAYFSMGILYSFPHILAITLCATALIVLSRFRIIKAIGFISLFIPILILFFQFVSIILPETLTTVFRIFKTHS